MKNNILYMTLAAVLMFSTGVQAKTEAPLYRGTVRVVADNIWRSGDNVNVEMSFSIDGRAVATNQALVLTPMLWNDAGSMQLPEVVINGQKRDKAYRRTQAIYARRGMLSQSAPYVVVKVGKKSATEVDYTYSFPFEPWMEEACLTLREELYGSPKHTRMLDVGYLGWLSAPKVETVVVIVRDTIREKPEILKKEGAAYLDFPIGQSRVLPDYGHNAVELERINSSLNSLWRDPKITIVGLYITGYASPDGSTALNKKLAMSRAASFRDYLVKHHGAAMGNDQTVDGGEDWAGLVEMIKSSSMDDKNAVLDIILNASSDEVRKSRLMSLDGGAPYRYMVTNFFPKLRRVQYRILYMESSVPLME